MFTVDTLDNRNGFKGWINQPQIGTCWNHLDGCGFPHQFGNLHIKATYKLVSFFPVWIWGMSQNCFLGKPAEPPEILDGKKHHFPVDSHVFKPPFSPSLELTDQHTIRAKRIWTPSSNTYDIASEPMPSPPFWWENSWRPPKIWIRPEAVGLELCPDSPFR